MLKRRGLARLLATLSQHSVALISLVVAVLALTINTERAEKSEYQRTTRDASFRVLAELSQLQLLIDQSHYGQVANSHSPIAGWARVNYMRDLAMVVPEPVPSSVERLFVTWGDQIDPLGHQINAQARAASLEANKRISEEIESARESVKIVLSTLN